MKVHEIIRIVNGVRYRCRDIACDDFDRAEENRYMVKHNLFAFSHSEVKSWFAHAKSSQSLPAWMPRGELPQARGSDQFSGGQEEPIGEGGFLVVNGGA